MLPDPRAIVFDMDDTLYPYRRFVLSGFRAVAECLEREHGADRQLTFRLMTRAMHGPGRGREIQACLDTLGLSRRLVPGLLRIIQNHSPLIRTPRATLRTLQHLRANGWRLGVLTNGPVARQRRRVRALALEQLTDVVVFAESHGTGTGKPDPAPFFEVARRLSTPVHDVVFVGDDEECDVMGAALAGMSTVRSTVWRPATGPTMARAVLRRMRDLPDLADHLVEDGVSRYAVA